MNELMTRLIIIFFILTSLTIVSYASFPIPSILDTPITDTILNVETTEQYHQRIQNAGFDISNCKCKVCRESNAVINKTSTNGNVRRMYILAGVLFGILIIWFVIMMSSVYRCLDNRSNCSNTPTTHTKNGTPKTLLWMTLLGAVSIGIAIKARIIQLKNKRNKS